MRCCVPTYLPVRAYCRYTAAVRPRLTDSDRQHERVASVRCTPDLFARGTTSTVSVVRTNSAHRFADSSEVLTRHTRSSVLHYLVAIQQPLVSCLLSIAV